MKSKLMSLTVLALLATTTTPVVAAAPATVAVPQLPTFPEANAQERGVAIANYLARFDSGWKDAYLRSTIETFERGGKNAIRQETYSLIRERDGGNQSLIRFLGPADVRGVGTLLHEHIGGTDDTWLYLPANRRTRRVSGANRQGSFQGTEFTFEDLSTFEVERYTWTFLEETEVTIAGQTHPIYRLNAVPAYRDSGYSKLVVDVNRDKWRIERAVYFDEAGRRLKTAETTAWEHVHGRFWRATHLEMRNQQTGKSTTIDFSDIRLDLARYPQGSSLTDEQLSRGALQHP